MYQYDPRFVDLPKDVYLYGFFQNEDYLKASEAAVRREFTLVTPLDDANRAMADQIRSVASVSIHIRRGDYAHDPDVRPVFGLMSLDYYDSAVKNISKRVAVPHFFVFSDDQEWAKANLRLDFPMTFIDFNGPERAYADLYLMSQCKHHIIANSSFSWWGAWLCTSAEQMVCAPHQWLTNSKKNAHQIIPNRWLKI
ncbi:MAG: alpha-1,2-fucosyltransferase [Burkholderiales bacterium]|nr:alpha-1,2-fucosyltransferase [Anaerolineae bacterium]